MASLIAFVWCAASSFANALPLRPNVKHLLKRCKYTGNLWSQGQAMNSKHKCCGRILRADISSIGTASCLLRNRTRNRFKRMKSLSTCARCATWNLCRKRRLRYATHSYFIELSDFSIWFQMHRPIHQDSGFKCLVCSNMFGRLTHLRRHIAFAHPEANKEQFDIVCNVCDRRFARTDNLQRHLLTHATSDVPLDHDIEKQLDCADCKQSFKSKEDLMTHDATCLATLEKSIDSNMTE